MICLFVGLGSDGGGIGCDEVRGFGGFSELPFNPRFLTFLRGEDVRLDGDSVLL